MSAFSLGPWRFTVEQDAIVATPNGLAGYARLSFVDDSSVDGQVIATCDAIPGEQGEGWTAQEAIGDLLFRPRRTGLSSVLAFHCRERGLP